MSKKLLMNEPLIRFNGFNDEWKKREFCEIFSERREKTVIEYEDTLLSCAIDGMFLNSELFGHFRGSSTIGYLKVQKYDLILSAQNLHLGNANVNLRFDSGIISPAYKVYNLHNYDPYFIQAWVKKDDTKRFFLAATTEGASQCRKNIEWSKLDSQIINVPNFAEQEKIGVFNHQIDKLIDFHQQKLDYFKVIMKVMLNILFPSNEISIPELRFKGFKNDWEQRKLGEIGETYTGLTGKSKENFGQGEGRYVTYKNVFLNAISNPLMIEPVENDVSQNKVQFGDVFFTTSSETPEEVGMSSIWLSHTDNTYLNSFCFGFRPTEKLDNYFLAYLLRSFQIRKKIIYLAQGISRYNISKNKVMEIDVQKPGIDEQERIGNLFNILDKLITMQQLKVDKIKTIKNILKNHMFI